jgi:hypothetical protein
MIDHIIIPVMIHVVAMQEQVHEIVLMNDVVAMTILQGNLINFNIITICGMSNRNNRDSRSNRPNVRQSSQERRAMIAQVRSIRY